MIPERLNKISSSSDRNKILNELQGLQKNLVSIVLTVPVSERRDDLLVAILTKYKDKSEKWLGVITLTAAVAPLLGLLGTVSGMIETFKMMTLFGAGDPSAVSGGISEALITTELGLIVAIPSIVISAYLAKKVKAYFSQIESEVIKLSGVK